MLFRHVVAETPSGIPHDVALHVGAEVCLHLKRGSLRPLHLSTKPVQTARWSVDIRHRSALFRCFTRRPVKTSTRIPTLSP